MNCLWSNILREDILRDYHVTQQQCTFKLISSPGSGWWPLAPRISQDSVECPSLPPPPPCELWFLSNTGTIQSVHAAVGRAEAACLENASDFGQYPLFSLTMLPLLWGISFLRQVCQDCKVLGPEKLPKWSVWPCLDSDYFFVIEVINWTSVNSE